MKKLFSALSVALCAGAVVAGGLDKVNLSISSVSTSAASSASSPTGSSKITGYIERIDIAFSTASNSMQPIVYSSNDLTGKTTTLLDITNLGTNTSYVVRGKAQDINGANFTTNDSQRFLVFDEAVYLRATNSVYAGQAIKCSVIYQRP